MATPPAAASTAAAEPPAVSTKPKSPRNELAVLEAGASTIISAYAAGIEIATLALEGVALVARLRAYEAGQAALNAYDAPHLDCAAYLLPGTDVGVQPGAVGSQALWHVLTIITLWFIIMSELPYRGWMDAWAGWAGPFGPESGSGYTGALQILIAGGILGTPIDTLGPSVFHGLRFYGAGMPLLVIGVLNLLIGWYYGSRIRPMRDQCDLAKSTDKAQNAEEARKKLVTGLAEVYAMRVPTGTLSSVSSPVAPSQRICRSLLRDARISPG